MSVPHAFTVSRCADAARSGDILKLVHLAFGRLSPPSGALKETAGDVAARFRAGLVLITEADGALVGSVFAALKGDGLYLTRMAVRPDWQNRGVATSTNMFARSLGSAVGVAAFGAIVNSRLAGSPGSAGGSVDLERLAASALAPAIHPVFVCSAVIALALLASGALMPRDAGSPSGGR